MTTRFACLITFALARQCLSQETPALAPYIAPGGVRDAAVLRAEIAPGMLISIFGGRFTTEQTIVSQWPLPDSVGGVAVEAISAAATHRAPLLFLSPQQINASIPYEVEGETVDIRVRSPSGLSNSERVPIVRSAPRAFAVVDVTSSRVSLDRPAKPGDVLTAYLTGLGALNAENLAAGLVRARIGAAAADVLYAGRPAGSLLDQINLQVPPDAEAGELPLELSVGDSPWEHAVQLSITRVAPSSRTFHVRTSAPPDADGSTEKPWSLSQALSHPAAVSPGDTILLHGGVYSGYFVSRLAGSPEAPIFVRAAAGERATIDSGSLGQDALTVNGSYTWYLDFEVRSSDSVRSTPNSGSFPGDIKRGACIVSNGPNNRYINLVLHDCSQGVSFWTPSVDSELYGNLIFYNGWDGGDRGHGHGIYTQNGTGVKRISENIIFDQFGIGIQAYGSNQASVRGYELAGNVVFNNGTLARGGAVDNILFAGGGTTKANIRLEGNHIYHIPASNVGLSRLGWQWDTVNKDVVAVNNHWIGGSPAIQICHWDSVAFRGNVIYSKSTGVATLLSSPENFARYQWDKNTYYGGSSFSIGGRGYSWADWKATARVDQTSRYTADPPSGTWAFVRPNRYQRGRANIVVYNWDRKSSVDVDISMAINPGQRFEIRDAQNFFGAPVLTGLFDGSRVSLPMGGLKAAEPIGIVPVPPRHTAPEFGVFVLLPVP